MEMIIMKCLQMALEGSIALLVIMLVRLILNKAPKNFICVLWMLALIRLCLPVMPQIPMPFGLGNISSLIFKENIDNFNAIYNADSNIENRSQYTITGTDLNNAIINSGNNIVNAENNVTNSDIYKNITIGITDITNEISATNGIITTQSTYIDVNKLNSDLHKIVDNGNINNSIKNIKVNNNSISNSNSNNGRINNTGANNINIINNGHFILSKNLTYYIGLIWFVGAICALGIMLYRYICFSNNMKEAITAGNFKGHIMKKHNVEGLPAVFGFWHPVIYIPYDFDEWGNENKREMILLHELTHIKRGDHVVRLISLVVLCVYWWNPLVWLSVKLFHSDIEMACDEGVLQTISSNDKKEYASVLLEYAVKRSGISIPVGFAENNTENRIKNILGFKKISVAISVLLVVVVGIFAVFMMSKPANSSTDLEDTENSEIVTEDRSLVELTENDSNVINDFLLEEGEARSTSNEDDQTDSISLVNTEFINDTWANQLKKYWSDRLVSEGVIDDPDSSLFFRNNISGDDENEFDYFDENQSNTDETKTDVKYDYYVIALSKDGEFSLYQSKLEGNSDDWIFEDTVHIEFNNIEDKKTLFDMTDELGILWTGSISSNPAWLDSEGNYVNIIKVITSNLQKYNEDKYFNLAGIFEDSISFWLHINGKVETVYPTYNKNFVKYNMPNGDTIYIEMYSYEGTKYPFIIKDKEWENYPDIKDSDLKEFDKLQKQVNILSDVKIDDLLNVTETVDVSNIKSEVYDLENKYLILDSLANDNASLYGMYGGDAMIVRIDDQIIPILINWISPQMIMPKLYAGDYDHDGEKEYLLKTHLRTGTGISGENIYIMDKYAGQDEYTFIYVDESKYYSQLDKLEYKFDETSKALTISSEESEAVLDLSEALKDGNKFVNFLFGGIDSFDIDGDNIIFNVTGGCVFDYSPMVQYDYAVKLSCPLEYSKSSVFVLGPIQLEVDEDVW